MDAPQRTRSCFRERIPQDEGTPRGSKQICIPMTSDIYHRIGDHAGEVRRFLEPLIQTSPELFPQGMQDGFQLTGRLPESEKMPGIRLRQVRLADEEHLTDAYGQFAQESRDVNPQYAPKTVNTDGWVATRNAFRALFLTIVPVLCFLHGFLKIRDRCRKARELHDRVWDVYRATTASDFRRRMARFRAWCQQGNWPKAVLEMVAKLWNRESDYLVSYTHPGCHRTSNLVDRLMNRLTRFLYAGRGLHGHQSSSERRLRGWALLQNFRPFAPRSGERRQYQSPAHRLNQKQYHVHWLHNLQVCTSLAGVRSPT